MTTWFCAKTKADCDRQVGELNLKVANLENKVKQLTPVVYDEQPETFNASSLQRLLKAYAPDAQLHSNCLWTAQPKWDTIVKLCQNNPFSPSKFKRPNIWCVQYASLFHHWAHTQVYGIEFGSITGDVEPKDPNAGGHAWNFARVDNKLLFIDYRGTMPAYVVPNSGYFVMEAEKIKDYRKIDAWYL